MAETAERLRLGGDEVTLRVTSAESDGAVLAREVRIPAGGGPPALHTHAPAETYRVERGELAIYRARPDGALQRTAAGPGAVVHIPGGREHTVRNESGAEAAAFVTFTPGAPMEGFIRAAAALGDAPMEQVLALAVRHGVAVTRPLPAPPG
jgi:oxalate decarboxylase/phosphoglucose isomerase-like protein (cupin superfamily)